MKFICIGYLDESLWDGMSESEQTATMDEVFAYHDELRQQGIAIGGEALQPAQSGATLRVKNGRPRVTDGPFAETKEVIGGIFTLEADDLDHAARIMSKHVAMRFGPIEIRPAQDLSEMERASERRRAERTQQ